MPSQADRPPDWHHWPFLLLHCVSYGAGVLIIVLQGRTNWVPPLAITVFIGRLPSWISVSIGNVILLHLCTHLSRTAAANKMSGPLGEGIQFYQKATSCRALCQVLHVHPKLIIIQLYRGGAFIFLVLKRSNKVISLQVSHPWKCKPSDIKAHLCPSPSLQPLFMKHCHMYSLFLQQSWAHPLKGVESHN